MFMYFGLQIFVLYGLLDNRLYKMEDHVTRPHCLDLSSVHIISLIDFK